MLLEELGHSLCNIVYVSSMWTDDQKDESGVFEPSPRTSTSDPGPNSCDALRVLCFYQQASTS